MNHREHRDHRDDYDKLTSKVIGCAIEVHRNLGTGLLESTYEKCLAHELSLAGVSFETQSPLPVKYKGIHLDCGYRIDLLIENQLIVELKAIENIQPIHAAQILTYMKLSEVSRGLLMNFNVKVLKEGIKRFSL